MIPNPTPTLEKEIEDLITLYKSHGFTPDELKVFLLSIATKTAIAIKPSAEIDDYASKDWVDGWDSAVYSYLLKREEWFKSAAE